MCFVLIPIYSLIAQSWLVSDAQSGDFMKPIVDVGMYVINHFTFSKWKLSFLFMNFEHPRWSTLKLIPHINISLPNTLSNIYKYSYFPPAITQWNSLPTSVYDSMTVESFTKDPQNILRVFGFTNCIKMCNVFCNIPCWFIFNRCHQSP